MAKQGFGIDQTRDSKRLVRGEHLLAARSLLRCTYGHNQTMRVLMLSGHNPAEEINAIRFLFSRAFITCVDLDPGCLVKASEAGADEILNIDIHAWSTTDTCRTHNGFTGSAYAKQYPGGIDIDHKFHLIDFDFCGSVTEQMRASVNAYKYTLHDDGVLMLTFSYGRDVAERFIAESRNGSYLNASSPVIAPLVKKGLSESLIGRVLFLAQVKGLRLLAVSSYIGAAMPMCAMLFQRGDCIVKKNCKGQLEQFDIQSVTVVEPSDLESMLLLDGLSTLYGTPAERIEGARRSAIALRASATRQSRISTDSIAA